MITKKQRFLILAPMLALWAGLCWSGPARAQEFFFKDGDRVLIMGDSITEQLLYSNYVEMWTVARFPTWKITFRNVGIGGDRSTGGNQRFKRDVLSFKPTAMTVDFGMNDGQYKAFQEDTFKVYMEGLKGIAAQAKDAKIRVAWITPQPVENKEDGPPLKGYNETLEMYSAGVEKTAQDSSGLFVDQFHPFLEVLNRARSDDPKARIGGGDAVHPGSAGQALMASAILKGLHFPTLVSSVEIDAKAAKVTKAENCTANDVTVDKGGLSFVRLDKALPFFPEDAKGILKWTPIVDELNEYKLKITGLKEGKYDVRIDGQGVGYFTAADLAKGVNLARGALAAGPVAEQVKKARGAVKAKNDYYKDQIFRGIVLNDKDYGPNGKNREDAVAEKMKKMPALEDAIHKALEMKPNKVTVMIVKE